MYRLDRSRLGEGQRRNWNLLRSGRAVGRRCPLMNPETPAPDAFGLRYVSLLGYRGALRFDI